MRNGKTLLSRTLSRLACISILACSGLLDLAAAVLTYPVPEGVKRNADFTVTVDGHEIDLYRVPVRRTMERYVAMGAFDFSGTVTVEVAVKTSIDRLDIRPKRAGIDPKRSGDRFTFELDRPRNLSIEVNGEIDRWNLLLFANPLEEDPPSPDDPGVIYFGAGLHTVGDGSGEEGNRIHITESGTTVYLAGGAVVRGAIFAQDLKDITVRGRGILDGLLMEHDKTKQKRKRALEFRRIEGLRVEGIILQDSPHHGLLMASCRDVEVDNFHNVSQNDNSDGINPISCRDVVIRNTFVRTVDDGIAIKNGTFAGRGPTENILVEDCAFWNDDWGNGIEIGFETRHGDHMRDITFHRVDILHSRCPTGEAITIHNGDAADIHRILFDDVVVEDLDGSNGAIEFFIDQTKYSKDAQRGQLRDVLLRRVRWPDHKRSRILGYSGSHPVANVTLEDCRCGGKPVLSAEDGRIDTNAHVKHLRFK